MPSLGEGRLNKKQRGYKIQSVRHHQRHSRGAKYRIQVLGIRFKGVDLRVPDLKLNPVYRDRELSPEGNTDPEQPIMGPVERIGKAHFISFTEHPPQLLDHFWSGSPLGPVPPL